MRNRFNITEEEKNRIRGLHKNYSIIKEQDSGPEERRKISQEDYATIMRNLGRLLRRTYGGKTVNLWSTTIAGEETADGPGTVEGDEVSSLGSWTIENVSPYSDLDEKAGEDTALIRLDFKFRANPKDESKFGWQFIDGNKGYVETIWECGDEYFTVQNRGSRPEGEKFTNLKLINKLTGELCTSDEWKEYDKLFSPNGNYVVTDMDVDFSMGDEDTETLA